MFFIFFLITKTTSDQFRTQIFAKMSLYFDILAISPILNVGCEALNYLLELRHVFYFT